MDKNIFFIIFLLLFLISIFFIYKLDLCRTNYQKLSNILKRNSTETLHLLNKVVQLKKNNKGNLLINHKNLYSNVNETFQSNQNCNVGNSSGGNSTGNNSNGNCPPCDPDEPCPSCPDCESDPSCEECAPCVSNNDNSSDGEECNGVKICTCPPVTDEECTPCAEYMCPPCPKTINQPVIYTESNQIFSDTPQDS